MSTISQKIFRNTLFNTLGNVFATTLQILIIPYIMLKLGQDRFGIWALVSVIFGVFTALDFGTGTAFVKYFSEYEAKKEAENFNRVMVAGFFLMVIFSSLLILVVFLLKSDIIIFFNIPIHLKNEATFVFTTAAIIFGFNNTFGVFQAILKGMQRMEISNSINIIVSTIYVIGIFGALHYGFGLRGLILIHGIRIFLINIASIVYSKKIFSALSFKISYFDFTKVKSILSYGVKMQINSIANLVNLQTDKTIIGYFLNLASVTAYEIGQKISLFSRMIVGLAFSALVPAISELDATGKRQSIVKLYERGNKYMASFAFPILIFTITFAGFLINLWMGSGFEKSVFVARLLVLGVFVNMLTGVGVMIVRGIGKPLYETEYAVICLVANIVLGILLVRAYGFSGVVIAAPISVTLGSIYFIVKFNSLYKFSFLSLARRAYLKPFLIAVGLAGILYLLSLIVTKTIQMDARIEFFLLVLANGVLYFPAFVWLLKKSGFWDEQDKLHLVSTVERYPLLGKLVAFSIG